MRSCQEVGQICAISAKSAARMHRVSLVAHGHVDTYLLEFPPDARGFVGTRGLRRAWVSGRGAAARGHSGSRRLFVSLVA